MKAIITKYATTTGVSVEEVEIKDDMCNTFPGTRGYFCQYFHGKDKRDWSCDKDIAMAIVREKFIAKRRSLNNALEKLAVKEAKALRLIEAAIL